MTDIINGEHHCIDPYLPLEEIQIHIENSEFPRKVKISNLHETNYSSYILKVDQDCILNGSRSQPRVTIKIKTANSSPVATFSYYSIY